jgi:Spy/CpxP family protein refolding chaperone
MVMKKIAIAIGMILFIAAVSLDAAAFREDAGPRAGYGYGLSDRMMIDMNLTADQTEKIRVLQEAHLNDIQPLRQDLYMKRQGLRLLWLEKTPDQVKITAVNQEIRTLRDQLEDKMTSHRLAVFKVLTPEQKAKIQAYWPGRGHGPGKGMRSRDDSDAEFGRGWGKGMRGY